MPDKNYSIYWSTSEPEVYCSIRKIKNGYLVIYDNDTREYIQTLDGAVSLLKKELKTKKVNKVGKWETGTTSANTIQATASTSTDKIKKNKK